MQVLLKTKNILNFSILNFALRATKLTQSTKFMKNRKKKKKTTTTNKRDGKYRFPYTIFHKYKILSAYISFMTV